MLHFVPKGLDQKNVILAGGTWKKLEFWNFRGQNGIKALWIKYLRDSNLVNTTWNFWNFVPKRWNFLESGATWRARLSMPIPKFQNVIPRFQFSWPHFGILEFWNFTYPWTTNSRASPDARENKELVSKPCLSRAQKNPPNLAARGV